MNWSKWAGVQRIDADTYLRRVAEEEAFHVIRQAERVAAADAECRHVWVSVSGTNDYECRACGAVKHDNGEVTGEW